MKMFARSQEKNIDGLEEREALKDIARIVEKLMSPG
jgi:hypothetical protein